MSSDLRTAIIENITIADFLRSEGYEVIPRGRKLTVKGHDSLVITPEKNVFTWNSRGFGGSVIDLYMGLHSCDARTAMTELRKQLPEYEKERSKPHQSPPAKPPEPKAKESVPLVLPTEDKSKWRRIYAYLISTRKITPTIVKWLVQEKTIYPDERGNLCYLGRDGKGEINYCARKGTLMPRDGQKGYRNVVEGSDYQKRCVMNHSPSHTKLVVTEAAVDAWSFASMLEIHGLDHKAYTYLSLETTYYDAKAVSFMGYLQGEQKYNFEFNPKENFSSFRHLLEKLSDTQALDQERLTILNKNLEDAKEAVNQPFAYEKEFQTKLARLNELNTVLNQEGGRTDMHPEIQALLTKIDQTYTAMVTDPQKYLDYLTFRGQCVGMGAENSVAVFAQNPKATYCPAPEALGSPNVKSGEEDHFVSVLRSDGIERVYALEQYDLPESEYLDNAPLQWTDAQHGDLMHRVEDAAHLADIPIVKDIRHGPGFFEAAKNTIHIREGENDTEQLKSLLEGYSEAVIARTSTVERPVAELESAALAALLQVRCGVPVDGQLSERITTALEDARQVSGFSMKDSVARLHNAMEYCVRYAELEQTSEQYHAQQIEPEAMTPQSEAFMEMM